MDEVENELTASGVPVGLAEGRVRFEVGYFGEKRRTEGKGDEGVGLEDGGEAGVLCEWWTS
jgi:hypothetical protein